MLAARKLYSLNCSLLAKQIFYLCSCSQKNRSARMPANARKDHSSSPSFNWSQAYVYVFQLVVKSHMVLPLSYRKSSIKPPGGLIFFKHFWGGALNREGGLKREGGGLFNLAKRIISSKNTVVWDRVDWSHILEDDTCHVWVIRCSLIKLEAWFNLMKLDSLCACLFQHASNAISTKVR